MSIKEELQIVVCSLGYVGLALAVEFGKKYHTIGFDINKERISVLTRGLDKTFEQTPHEIQSA
jgi:UDP-N-acetyl-D-galactosamine dehydrogenase